MAEFELRIRPSGRAMLQTAHKLSAMRKAENYPHTAKAVRDLTKEAQRVMLRAVQGKKVHWTGGEFTINRIEGRLHGSILGGLRYPYQGNPLRGAIEIKIAFYKYIRDGVKPYDMKPGLLASPKAKLSKKGIRYVVVPMREHPHRWARRVFRIVTSRSKGWIHPGTAPKPLGKYATEVLREKAARQLREALKRDLGAR